MSNTAQWTWLVYMAGDNNLEGAGRDDLAEMKQVGSTPQVNVLVQFDTEQNTTRRYRVEKNKLKMLQKMAGVNSGDPKVLTDFIRWGTKNYPARHYLVDVWNHGGGWENLPADYDYDSIRSAKPHRAAKLSRVKRSLFRTTVNKIDRRGAAARAIAIDCGSHDYLDNQELRDAVAKGIPAGSKIDILGCDACLMNMLEIAYEMKDTTTFMVGSEETEPGAGWPYADILRKLTAKPTMTPADLARLIVTRYGDWYQRTTGESVTQSALNLGRVQTVAKAVDALASALIKDGRAVAGAVSLARDRALKFEYSEYLDLGDFALQLGQRLPQGAKSRDAAVKLSNILKPAGGNSFIVQNTASGKCQNASGVSIYFPPSNQYAPDYADLSFSKQTQWPKFLQTYFGL